jgi:hypothetical protein
VIDEARRSLQALRRLERESRRRAAHAGDDLRRFAEREEEVKRRLEAAGYLQHRPPE